ncbi:beta-ketoacyl synthase N-terminal-like domain-containing protein [Actinomycetospora aeridis]|uniref:Beta-ketoacyl synthase N-terminal-like domain-containing protein n=1 Tax=Actinomycetospora aeridis TaxID=3129231 RepID=A0ABU8NAS1_9PSEU
MTTAPTATATDREPVAVVGLSCLLPGAHTPVEFWETLRDGADRRTDGGHDRFGTDPSVPGGWGDDAHRVTAVRGGFVTEPDVDLTGLHLPAETLAGRDRVVRWSLHTARQALADAGLRPGDPRLARTGIALGNYSFPTASSSALTLPLVRDAVREGLRRGGVPAPDPDPDAADGAPDPHELWSAGEPVTVVTDALGLGGPGLSLDAACSSALYGMALARDLLETGRADVMLAGAVCAPDPLLIHLSFSDLGAYPDNGVSQPFDATSRGIVTGQGAGLLVLKRLSDARRDGDEVHAVIESLGLSNDGAGRHLLSPNVIGQLDTYRRAYDDAGVDPRDVDYVECHATGTPLGDTTELAGIAEFFTARGAEVPRLGSVKANLGHLLTVAGLSSVLKVVLAMRHGQLPATPGVGETVALPHGEHPGLGERVVRAPLAWERSAERRRLAGVSAFGFGGTDAHVVLADRPATEPAVESVQGARRSVPPRRASDPVALVGLGVRAAGIHGVDDLHDAVRTATPRLGPASAQRWYGLEDAVGSAPPEGGHLDDVEVDVRTYRIPPAQLGHANPQHAAFFDAAEQALADAGLTGEDAPDGPRRIAVVVAMDAEPHTNAHRARFDIGAHVRADLARAGVALDEADVRRLENAARGAVHPDLGANEVLSYIGNVMASRVCAAHDFTGPSFTVSADTTAGARALDVATLLLRDPSLEAVLVGGVDLAAGAENVLARRRVAEQDGEDVPPLGDGAAAVVVTRPRDVTGFPRHHATVDAMVLDTGVGGRSAVAAAARDALTAAGRRGEEIDHLELGAPGGAAERAEHAGLAEVYRSADDSIRHDRGGLVGRLSDLTGDLQRASVLAALVKVATCLRLAELPPAPDGVVLDAAATPALDGSALRVPASRRPWLRRLGGGPRLAALSTVGHRGPIGRPAAHLVLSSAPDGPTDHGEHRPGADWAAAHGPLLLPLAGDGVDALLAAITARRDELAAGADVAGLVREATAAFTAGPATAVLVAPDAAALRRELEAALGGLGTAVAERGEWMTPTGSYATTRPIGPDGRIAFVYPGAFTTYPEAGQDLFRLFPGLRRGLEREVPSPRGALKLEALFPAGRARLGRRDLMRHEAELIDDIPTVLATGTTLAVLHTRLLGDVLGVAPDGGFGYSLGESSMLFASGVWATAERDDVALRSSPLFRDQLRGRKGLVRRAWDIPDDVADDAVWATYVVLAPVEDVRAALAGRDRVFLTHVNTPREVVVAGDPAQCAELVAAVGGKSARAPANHVMHNPVVAPVREALAGLNSYALGEPPSELELLSAFDHDRVDVRDRHDLAERIAATLTSEIDFVRLTRTAHDRGFRYFVEVGPGATCTRWVGETLADAPHVAVSADRRGAGTAQGLASALARLAAHGVPVALEVLLPPAPEAAPARPAMTFTVVNGAESVVEQVARATTDVLAAPTERAVPQFPTEEEAAVPATPQESPEDEPIVLEAEPFVFLPRREEAPPAPTSVPAGPPSGGQVRLALAVADAHRAAVRAHEAAAGQAVATLLAGDTPPPELPAPPPRPPRRDDVLFDEHDMLEFARGKVANVFGERFAEVDTYDYRVRLPEPPYLFVSRVTDLHGETGRFEPSTITTEFDVPADAWFTVDGLAPTAVTVEAGQCDLLLISYLGIDFESRGERVYRLLDSTLRFVTGLPRAGQTLRYEISIDRFVRDGGTLLFFFSYRCFADGELCLELTDACAGFFNAAELDASLGVVETVVDRRRRAAMTPAWFKPLARTDRTALGAEDLRLLSRGRLAEVFGPAWDQHADGCNPSIRLPDERLRMIDEITAIDRLGGPRGLGELTATTELDPDGWYFACHFTGDPVLAGSLVAEGGVQLLQVYAMYLGLHLVLPDAEFQAIPDLTTKIKVRGQITPGTPRITYRAEITDVTMLPRPAVVADLTIYDGDKPIISVQDFGIQVREKPGTDFRPGPGGVPPFLGRRTPTGEATFVNELHLAHAAKGDLAVTMGPEFEIYAGRRAPHIPNGDFRFVDRIVAMDGTRGQLRPGATMISEYDVPPEAWYLAEAPGGRTPHCVVLESSLQAAIFLGYYLGATLQHPDADLCIRNLDGSASYVADVDLRGRTVRQHTEMLSSSSAGGTVLQSFRYELSVDGVVFHRGESLFGYFPPEALATQVGLDNGRRVAPWLDRQEALEGVRHLDRDEDWFTTAPALGDGHLRLVDAVDLVEGGGDHGRGYVRASRRIDHDDWYFSCHFHRDPVMPGSLGVEAVLQALQIWTRESGLSARFADPVFAVPTDVATGWRYRGQILRDDPLMLADAHVREVHDHGDRVVVVADAGVWRVPADGEPLRIYELTAVAIEVRDTRTARTTPTVTEEQR